MKLSIRLQNHGCANHPYWWVVVAPNRKNIKGRFVEHLGYWAPRQGVLVDRQITLNMPRIKYWMGNGAVPTSKIQKFLSLWDVMPEPFYVPKEPLTKPEDEMSDHEKAKQRRKQKRRERLKLHYINYHKPMANYKSLQTYHYVRHYTKMREKIQAAERENQILRELLMHSEFVKVNRVNELSGGAVMDDTAEMTRLEGQLAQAKAELALLDQNLKGVSNMQRIGAIKEINGLVDRIREVEKRREPFRRRDGEGVLDGESVSKGQLDRQLEYELITKKIDKMNKEMEILERLNEAVHLEEYANFLQVKEPELSPEEALELAQDVFIQRGERNVPPMTKYELYYEDELQMDPNDIFEYDEEVEFERKGARQANAKRAQEEALEGEEPAEEAGEKQAVEKQEVVRQREWRRTTGEEENDRNLSVTAGLDLGIDLVAEDELIRKVHEQNLLKFIMSRPDVVVPTNRPVHPFPDLETYVPEEYYEPISDLNLQVVHMDSLEPNDELLKYHNKRAYSSAAGAKSVHGSQVAVARGPVGVKSDLRNKGDKTRRGPQAV